MRRIFQMAAIISALVLSFSCNKNEVVIPDTQDVKLNLTVNYNTPETRATKAGWANGDKIYAFFLESGKTITAESEVVCFSYNGSKWNVTAEGQAVLNKITKSGKVGAWYVSGQELTWAFSASVLQSNEAALGSERMNYFGDYSFADGVITVSLNMTYAVGQITVKGLNYSDGWELITINSATNCQYHMSRGMIFRVDRISNYSGTYNSVSCTANDDGVAFFGWFQNPEQEFDITLKDQNGNKWHKNLGVKNPKIGNAYILEKPTEAGGWDFTPAS